MVICQYEASRDDALRILDESIRQLGEAGHEAAFILVGPESYRMLRKAIGERFQRGAGTFETYQYVPIVLDPFRGAEICVVPGASAMLDGVQTYSFPAG